MLPSDFVILRVQFTRHGEPQRVMIQKSSGDVEFDGRALEFARSYRISRLHHGRNAKGARLSQWYDIKYMETPDA